MPSSALLLEAIIGPTLGGLLLAQCLFFVFNGNNTMLPVFMIDKFAVQAWQIALLFAVGGITIAVMQGGLVGPLVKRFGEKPLAVNSLLIQALAAVGLVSLPAFWMQYPMAVINSLGTGLIWPTFGALLANSVSHDEQGKVSGVGTALGSLMSVFGPLWAGAAYDGSPPSLRSGSVQWSSWWQDSS
jgi:MFS family permease